MNEQEKKELLKMARQILGSKTKYTEVFQRLIRIYHDDLGKAQTLVEPTKKEEVFIRVRRQGGTVLQEMKELKKMTRQLYEDRTGQKWRPSLRVIQGGGNTTPITRIVTYHNKRPKGDHHVEVNQQQSRTRQEVHP